VREDNGIAFCVCPVCWTKFDPPELGDNEHGIINKTWCCSEGCAKQRDTNVKTLRPAHTLLALRRQPFEMSNLEHRAVVENAIGKPLRRTAPVHHVNENKRDNSPSNLVACDSTAYHHLLHRRQRAFYACGDPNKTLNTRTGRWE